jgi:hypothetical protein
MATAKKKVSKKSAELKSFEIGKESKPFMTFRVTDQTIYWSILFIYILVLSIWVLNIQLDTMHILDSIK